MPAKAWAELLAPALAVALLAGPAAAEPPAGRQGELIHLLRHDCGSCHGLTLKGGLGPALLPGDLEGLPGEGLAVIILDGVPGTPMPPWRGLLAEEEAAWLAERLLEGIE
jgi:cytochrome c55X